MRGRASGSNRVHGQRSSAGDDRVRWYDGCTCARRTAGWTDMGCAAAYVVYKRSIVYSPRGRSMRYLACSNHHSNLGPTLHAQSTFTIIFSVCIFNPRMLPSVVCSDSLPRSRSTSHTAPCIVLRSASQFGNAER